MGGMRLRIDYGTECNMVTCCCSDHTVSKERYCVAYNLTGVFFCRSSHWVSFCSNFLPDLLHALHCSALHVTTPVKRLPINKSFQRGSSISFTKIWKMGVNTMASLDFKENVCRYQKYERNRRANKHFGVGSQPCYFVKRNWDASSLA